MDPIQSAVASSKDNFSWIQFDKKEMKGKFIEMPSRELIPENINEQLIVELYSK